MVGLKEHAKSILAFSEEVFSDKIFIRKEGFFFLFKGLVTRDKNITLFRTIFLSRVFTFNWPGFIVLVGRTLFIVFV